MREKTSHQIMMISLLCIFELALSLLIIKYVSYTEIDWIAYGEEVDGFFQVQRVRLQKVRRAHGTFGVSSRICLRLRLHTVDNRRRSEKRASFVCVFVRV